jgi:D-cysteine desulfhydrase
MPLVKEERQSMMEPILTVTPVQEFPLANEGGNRIWIKRDDLLPFSFGGNKVRIAWSFLEDCLARNCDAMIMYGDRRSNLCRVLSSMCAAAHIETIMIETSEHEESSRMPFNEKMIRLYGTRILQCRKDRIADTVDRAFEMLREEGKRPYYIYGNRFGTGNEGTAVDAYVKACPEILQWESDTGNRLAYLFTACGTGSTLAGLTAGMLEARSKVSVIGISISSRSSERAESCLNKAARAWYEKEGRKVPQKLEEALHVETKYNCGGYGIVDQRVTDLIDRVFLETSISLDPTYTGKALQGMLDYLKEHEIRDQNILFLHTGGLPLYFDYLAEKALPGDAKEAE